MIKDIKTKKDNIEKKANIHPNAFVAETANVIGEVTLGSGSSIWYSSVVRGDMNYVKIGKKTNIQDNATIHVDTNFPCIIGNYVTIGHNAVVHGCEIGNNTLIGMGAIILDGAIIGENCIIGAGSLITEGAVIPSNSLVIGSPGKVRRKITEEEIKTIKQNAIRYEKLWQDEHV